MNALVGGIVLLLCTIGQVAANQVFEATRAGDPAAVERLLNNGVAVDEPGRNGETALIVAALNGRPDLAKLLLAHGADVTARNAGGFTPLHAAAYSGSVQVASLLLQHGAPLEDADNKARVTPLLVAADEGRADMVEFLIGRGATFEVQDKDGFTPLSQAWSKKHVDVVRLLKQHGATCQPAEVLGSVAYYRQCVEAGQ